MATPKKRRAPARVTPPKRRPPKKGPGWARVLGRRVGRWAVVGTGHAVGAGVRHGTATVGRVSSTAHHRITDVREQRRLHGHRAAVREGDGPPMSLPQVAERLMLLDQAREDTTAATEGRAPRRIAWAQPAPPPSVLRAAAAPIRLSSRQLARLPEGWDAARVHATQAIVTDHLTDRLAQPASVPAGGWPLGRPPHPVPVRPPQPVPAAGPVTMTKGNPTMIEPTNFAELADPQIEQRNWQEELPAHARAASAFAAQQTDAVEALVEYHRQAQSREDVTSAYGEAAEAYGAFVEAMQRAAQRAEDWANNIELPRFDKAS